MEKDCPQFLYWNITLRLEKLLLKFLKATRNPNFERYMIDVATYDYDFSSSMADGSVGITLIFTQQPEVAVSGN